MRQRSTKVAGSISTFFSCKRTISYGVWFLTMPTVCWCYQSETVAIGQRIWRSTIENFICFRGIWFQYSTPRLIPLYCPDGSAGGTITGCPIRNSKGVRACGNVECGEANLRARINAKRYPWMRVSLLVSERAVGKCGHSVCGHV